MLCAALSLFLSANPESLAQLCDKGTSSACTNLGLMYANGDGGVPLDRTGLGLGGNESYPEVFAPFGDPVILLVVALEQILHAVLGLATGRFQDEQQ